MSRPTAPLHLSPESKRLYRKIVADYALGREPAALETLRLACEALDRCTAAREVIDTEGALTIDRFGQSKPHPAIGIERDSRIAALRAFRELSLDSEFTEPRSPRTVTERSADAGPSAQTPASARAVARRLR